MHAIGKGWTGLLALTCLVLVGCAVLGVATCGQQVVPSATRLPQWAQPLDVPGLPNLHKVSDDLYRGAQPTAEGFRRLQAMGIRTVVNLRAAHSDRDEMGGANLQYEEIPMHAWHAEDEDIVRFLQIVSDSKRTPVFVHCQHGADRTGVAVAAYRIAVQGWSVDDAVDEMLHGGYGFHEVWSESLPEYLEQLNLDEIKRQAGLAQEPAPAPAQ
jgi:protein tyrosine/serine phosphatase